MQELIEKLIQEVGLSNEQASKTIQVILQFVKAKVPPAFASNIDAMFSGVKTETNQPLETKEQSYKDKAEDFAEATKEKLEELAEQAKEKLSEAADKAEDIAKDVFGKVKDWFDGDKDKK